jgi:hypothetical protein
LFRTTPIMLLESDLTITERGRVRRRQMCAVVRHSSTKTKTKRSLDWTMKTRPGMWFDMWYDVRSWRHEIVRFYIPWRTSRSDPTSAAVKKDVNSIVICDMKIGLFFSAFVGSQIRNVI